MRDWNFIHVQVAATSYFSTYVDDTDAIPDHKAGLLIVFLWIGITLGRIAGIQDQMNLDLDRLYRHVQTQAGFPFHYLT